MPSLPRSPRGEHFTAGSRRPAMPGEPAGPRVGADLAAEGAEFPGADLADNDVRGHLAADPGTPGQVRRGAPLIRQQRGQIGGGRQHAHHRSGKLHRVSANDHTRLPQLEPRSRRQIQQRGAEAITAPPPGEQCDYRGRRRPLRRHAGTLPQHSDHRLPAPGQRSLHLWNGRSGRTVQHHPGSPANFSRMTCEKSAVNTGPAHSYKRSGWTVGKEPGRGLLAASRLPTRGAHFWPGRIFPPDPPIKTGWADPLAHSPMEAPRGAGIPADKAAGIPESLSRVSRVSRVSRAQANADAWARAHCSKVRGGRPVTSATVGSGVDSSSVPST